LLVAIDIRFAVTLVLMCHISGRTQAVALSCMMQSSTLDLSTAVDMITVTHDELSENRNQEAHFSKVWTDAMSLCQSCSIDCSASNNVSE